MIWSFVNSSGDVLPQKFHGPAHLLSVNTPEGCIAIAENIDRHSQRFENGQIVDYLPPQPSDDHEWNAGTKRWVLKQAVLERDQAISSAKAEIARLESAQLRPLRELALDNADTIARSKVAEIDEQIAIHRAIILANKQE